ncbi:Uncharacterized protein GBIM_11234 [Gryllus bimaculatus]|nr:Uncharacterized protein GBIM_11234 [Gryllus bimaculatus]
MLPRVFRALTAASPSSPRRRRRRPKACKGCGSGGPGPGPGPGLAWAWPGPGLGAGQQASTAGGGGEAGRGPATARARRRRRRIAPAPDTCTSGSATSVDLHDLPFDMPKLRRRLRGAAPPGPAPFKPLPGGRRGGLGAVGLQLQPISTTDSSGVSQASSSQSVQDTDRPHGLAAGGGAGGVRHESGAAAVTDERHGRGRTRFGRAVAGDSDERRRGGGRDGPQQQRGAAGERRKARWAGASGTVRTVACAEGARSRDREAARSCAALIYRGPCRSELRRGAPADARRGNPS